LGGRFSTIDSRVIKSVNKLKVSSFRSDGSIKGSSKSSITCPIAEHNISQPILVWLSALPILLWHDGGIESSSESLLATLEFADVEPVLSTIHEPPCAEAMLDAER